MRASSRASFARGCARIALRWRGCGGAPMPIGSTGAVPCPRSATQRRACWRWGWRRERTARIAPGGRSRATDRAIFCIPVLHAAGFASQPKATSRDDGMKLTGLWITSVARCAPPGNKPTPEELRNCAPWLDEEMRLLTELARGGVPGPHRVRRPAGARGAARRSAQSARDSSLRTERNTSCRAD